MLGTNGHRYTRDLRDLRDKRVKSQHIGDVTNIRMPNGTRREIVPGRPMRGTSYDEVRRCRTCNERKNKKEFLDYAVMERDRRNNSLNIHCRDCQVVKYASGYRQDGFVAADEAEAEDEDEEEAEDEDEEDADEEEDEQEEAEDADEDDGDEEDEVFEVEYIVSHRIKNDGYEFLVRWLNYSDEEDTWEPRDELKHLDVFKQYVETFL